MDKQAIIKDLIDKVKAKFNHESTGHDWFHIERVYKLSLHIGEKENADLFVCQLGALLHDIADHKFHDGDENIGPETAQKILSEYNLSEQWITPVVQIVREVTFKGAGVNTIPTTLEGRIVQDADRLDAIGAIGIARTFAYGGAKNRMIYHPDEPPVLHDSFDAYKNSKGHTINHFYEKLLLLKDLMNTNTGKQLAEQRHQLMLNYLEAFYSEWNVELKEEARTHVHHI